MYYCLRTVVLQAKGCKCFNLLNREFYQLVSLLVVSWLDRGLRPAIHSKAHTKRCRAAQTLSTEACILRLESN